MNWLSNGYLLFVIFCISETKLLDKFSKIKWSCADEYCSEPISLAVGLKTHFKDDPLKVNFKRNDEVWVLGKPIGDQQHWLVKVGDEKGIAQINFLQERQVIINKGKQIESIIDLNYMIKERNNFLKEAIKPSPSNIVVDGTTISSYEEGDSVEYEREAFSDELESLDVSKTLSAEDVSSVQFDASNTLSAEDVSSIQFYADQRRIKDEQFSRTEVNPISGVPDSNETKNDIPIEKNEVNYSIEINNSLNTHPELNNTNEAITEPKITDISIETSTENHNLNVENEKPLALPTKDLNNVPIINAEGSSIPKAEVPIFLSNNEHTSYSSLEGNINESYNNITTNEKEPVLEAVLSPQLNIPILDSVINADELNASILNLSSKPFETQLSDQSMDINNSSEENPDSDTLEHDNEINSFVGLEVSSPPILSDIKFESKGGNPAPKELDLLPVQTGNNSVYNILATEEVLAVPHQAKDTDFATEVETADHEVSVPEVKTADHEVSVPEVKNADHEVSVPEVKNADHEVSVPEVKTADHEVSVPEVKTADHEVSVPEVETADHVVSVLEVETADHEVSVPEVKTADHEVSVSEVETADHEVSVLEPIVTVSDSPATKILTAETSLGYGSEGPLLPAISSNEHVTEAPITVTPYPVESETPVSIYSVSFSEPPSTQEPVTEQTSTTPSEELVEKNIVESTTMPTINYEDFVEQEGNNWFSGFSSVMESIKEMFSKSDISINDADVNLAPSQDYETITESNKDGMNCDNEPYCFQPNDQSNFIEEENKPLIDLNMFFDGFPGSEMSMSTIICLIITSVVVLLFSLGYYYLENLKQDTALIAKINTLSTELFFAQKELASIEEQYQQSNETYKKLHTETSNNERTLEDMKKELEENHNEKKALKEDIARLEKEIESLAEQGDEMHKMLSESLTEEDRMNSLLSNITDLKSVLSGKLLEITSLTEQLDKEKQEVELLSISLKKSEEKCESVEDKLAKLLHEADFNTLAVTKEFEDKILSLENIIEERSLECTNFEKQISELKGACATLTLQKELAETELKKAHGVSSGKALNDWMETKDIRANLLAIQKENKKLRESLEEVNHHGTLLEGKEKELLQEIKELNDKYESAEKNKIEALTKLQVLSNYFKEKEIQLQEELGTKESQWLQKQSEDHTIYEQMRSLREENLSYKAQNEALKNEIIDQEASFKIQVANEEQKAQENWINLRHTERRLKEVQMEASLLRSRLTTLEANPDSLDDKHKSLEMVNGDVPMGAASPPFMLYPPPDYIPPPPLVSPTRPPPLGRLSSPPLTPPAPLSHFDYYSPPPPSPPPPLRMPKPQQPRDSHRKQKDSQSSNHSSESIEKPVRRGKR